MGTRERRARERDERRAAILEAARHVFLEKGLGLATMDDVAMRAELSKGALYLYFPSKEDLFLALALAPLDALLARIEAESVREGTGAERIERLLRTHASAMWESRDLFRLAMALRHERERSGDLAHSAAACAFRDGKRRIFGHYLDAVRAGHADGTVRPEIRPELLASQLWASMLGATVMQVHSDRGDAFPEAAPVEEVIESMIRVFTAHLRAPRSVGRARPREAAHTARKRSSR